MFLTAPFMRLKGRVETTLRRMQPTYYGLRLGLRTRLSGREARAPAPFDTRMWYHNLAIEGGDGYLFHRDHDAIEQLTGGLTFRRRQIDVWIEALRARIAWCEANASHFRMVIVPEKHVVHADKLPRRLSIAPERPVTQLLAALDPATARRVSYPVDLLRASPRATFFKTDTHWTPHGAFLVYRHLIESLAPDIALDRIEGSDIVWRERPFVGDIGVRFDPERGELASFPDPGLTYSLVFQNHNFGRGAVHIYENARRDLPHCVLFRDSFANALIPFLMGSFSRIVAVSSLSCYFDLLEKEKPDVVLFLIVERFVATFGLADTIQLPDDLGNLRVADLLPQGAEHVLGRPVDTAKGSPVSL